MFKYDEVYDKGSYFDAPPIEFESSAAFKSNAIQDVYQSKSDLSKSPNYKTQSDEKQKPYLGWQRLSDVILSKNLHKMNFIKNWRDIYK